MKNIPKPKRKKQKEEKVEKEEEEKQDMKQQIVRKKTFEQEEEEKCEYIKKELKKKQAFDQKQSKRVMFAPMIINKKQGKYEKSDIRKRQQSCMITDLSKDERPKQVKGFNPARRMTLINMLQLDTDDKELELYKKSLCGDNLVLNPNKETPEVEVCKIIIVCKDRKGGNIKMNFKNKSFDKTNDVYTIKEGSIYHMRIYFRVRYDIVYGLKWVNIVKKHGFKVDSHEEMMGTFAPKHQLQFFNLTPEECPKGFFARGNYSGKAMFIDQDGLVHMQYTYSFKIASDW